MKIVTILAAALLAGCSAQQLASFQAGAGTAQTAVVNFCKTDQPVIGTVATVVVAGVAAAAPSAAVAGPITGLIVQDVNGICAGILNAQPVPAPAPGTQIVVPKS